RYGGEEFVLICRDVDALRASRAAHRIKELVGGQSFKLAGRELTITVSLGVADLSMLLEPSAKALVEAADAALYAAKRNGRNRVEIYDPESEPTRAT
ncbi:MAG: diguanylate cyclase, partial [Myxococcales bacterium]|nr:diguanylate cyclase [Myxococcales bacterium]